MKEIGDLHRFRDSPIFRCKQIYISQCNKNFIAYWVNSWTFPLAERIVLDNHPCDWGVFQIYSSHRTTELIIRSQYRRYYEWWADPGATNIVLKDDFSQEHSWFMSLPSEEPVEQ